MTTKKVVKKSKPTKRPELSVGAKRVVKDALENPEANDAIRAGAAPGPAKNVSKVVHLTVSVGNDGRAESFEKFVERLTKAIGTVPYGQQGTHAAVTGGYYILDGAVCRPEDYDPKKHTFKSGTFPPTWAGGPKDSKTPVGSQQRQMDWDLVHLSSDEYDQKYKIGKYAPKPAWSESNAEHTERMRKRREEAAAEKAAKEDEELEEFGFEDEETPKPKKRVVKKKATKKPAKKTVRIKR